MARAGASVVLIDKAVFPRPKACGEGIMPGGLPVLGRLGVLPEVEAKARPFRGVRFTSPRGREATGYFPEGRGLAIHREELDLILLRKAQAHPGIQVLEGRAALYKEGLRLDDGAAVPARRLVIADGAHSRVADDIGSARRPPRAARFGLRTRYEGVQGLSDVVEVFIQEGGEIYLAPQRGDGNALVSILLEERRMARFAGRTTEAFEEALHSCRPLAARLADARRVVAIQGAGPFGLQRERRAGPGWLLAGDAAGGVDPITGEGIALALKTGELAAEATLRALRGEPERGVAVFYEARRKALVRRKTLLSRFLLGVVRRPLMAETVVASLAAAPALFSLLLSDD